MYLEPTEVLQRINGRPVHVWGAMIVGQGVVKALGRHGIPVAGFLDSSPALQGSKALGLEVRAPGTVLADVKAGRGYIVIGSGHYDLEIEGLCREAGLVAHEHYLLSRELNDVDPSVDISGTCNLHCVSCPRGNMDNPDPVGFMDVEDYGRVLDKLLTELPFLGSIQLYTWGEPFLNRQLPQIIARTREAGVLTAISTNLNARADMEAAVRARPDWIKVSASGFGETYGIGHTGGNWERFLANLESLCALRDLHHPDLHIILNYHLYRHSLGESYRSMKMLCEQLGIVFRPNMAYLYSMDNVQDYVEGKPLSAPARATLDMLLMDIDEGLARSRARRHLPCPEDRCLPIDWNRRVRFCGVYFKPEIASDILTTSVAQILARRHGSPECMRCMSHGLHQFTGVYLEEKLLDADLEGGHP